MPRTSPFPRLTSGGLSAVLVAGVLVASTSPPASAGGGSSTYTCDFGPLGTLLVPVAMTVPDLPDQAPGAAVPAGALDPTFDFDTTSLGGVLAVVTSPSASGMALGVGEQTVPLQGFAFGTPSGSSLPASATSSAFTAPATPGAHHVTMPDAFTFTGVLPGALPGLPGSPVSAPCLTDAPAVLGTLIVLPLAAAVPSTTEAKVVKKRLVKGKRAKIRATVIVGQDPLTQPGTGDVTVRKGKRTIGTGVLEEGETTIRTKRFKKPGRYKLKVLFPGDELTDASSDTVRVRVVRRR